MRYRSASGALFAFAWLVWATQLGAQQVAVSAGTIHPVSGPAIENGVVLVDGDRIVAVGSQDEVEIPADATVLSYPEGHVYPGLVDALTDAFADESILDDNGSDAGTAIVEGLDRYQSRSEVLVTYGVTTAYVRNGGETRWRGIGAVLRPRREGYEVGAGKPAVQMLLRGTGVHPLIRQRGLAGAGNAFDAIEAYEKRFEDHRQALAEYETEYREYLDYHRARAGQQQTREATARSGRRGRGQRGRGQRGRGQRARGGRRGGGDQGATGGGGAPEPEGEDTPPAKPDYPEAPTVEPDKEALREVLSGERSLRIEVEAADEVRAALRLQRDRGIARVVLEHARDAGPMAAELARRGIPVVLADFLPGPDTEDEVAELPARLAASEVSIAIASGSVRRARHLPLLAAHAVGEGLDPHTALRAITLTPAEILGVSRDVGSLETGKLADLVVFSAPIFSSDARVLCVLSAGSTQYEAR